MPYKLFDVSKDIPLAPANAHPRSVMDPGQFLCYI